MKILWTALMAFTLMAESQASDLNAEYAGANTALIEACEAAMRENAEWFYDQLDSKSIADGLYSAGDSQVEGLRHSIRIGSNRGSSLTLTRLFNQPGFRIVIEHDLTVRDFWLMDPICRAKPREVRIYQRSTGKLIHHSVL